MDINKIKKKKNKNFNKQYKKTKTQKNHKIKKSFQEITFWQARWVLLQIPISRQPTPPRWYLLATVNIFYNWLIGSGATFNAYVCVSGGKKCLFFRKLGVLCFLVTSVL